MSFHFQSSGQPSLFSTRRKLQWTCLTNGLQYTRTEFARQCLGSPLCTYYQFATMHPALTVFGRLDAGSLIIVVGYNDRWRRFRRMLHPMLQKKATETFYQSQERQARLLLRRILGSCNHLESSRELEGEIYQYVVAETRYTLTSVTLALFLELLPPQFSVPYMGTTWNLQMTPLWRLQRRPLTTWAKES
jgi:hypothetical protein